MKTTILILMILLIPLAYALDNCKEIMHTDDIPCLLILPVNTSETPCNTLNVSVYVNGSNLLYIQPMHDYNSFKCNATFNQTGFGTYTGQYETEDTFTLIVEEDKMQEVWFYGVSLLIFFILVGIGYAKEIVEFVMISGMLAMIIGIALFIYGFPNLTNDFLRNSIVAVICGIGAYLILEPAMDFFERWKD